MKSIIISTYGGPEVLEYRDSETPLVGDNQVIIDVRGASVNSADIQVRSGKYHLDKSFPFIPGLDAAGVVASVGDNVTTIAPGDRVIAFPVSGSYAQQVVAEEALTFTIPATIDFKTAAAMPVVAGTVTHMLTAIARIQPGETLLVHGASGGVGTTVVQIAQALGVKQIIGSVSSSEKGAYVKRLGAWMTIDYSDPDYAVKVNKATEGRGVDVILNSLGGHTLERDSTCLAPFGRLICFGKLSGTTGSLTPESLYPTNRSVIGFSFGHYRKFNPDAIQKTMKRVINMAEDGLLKMTIDSCFPLKDAPLAHMRLESRKAVGKILLYPINSE